MKTNKKWVPLFVLLLLLSVVSAMAQSKHDVFWVVEGNVKHRDYTMIRFYNAKLQLLKEERISRKFLDIRKKKNRRLLDTKLKEFLYPEAMANRKRT